VLSLVPYTTTLPHFYSTVSTHLQTQFTANCMSFEEYFEFFAVLQDFKNFKYLFPQFFAETLMMFYGILGFHETLVGKH